MDIIEKPAQNPVAPKRKVFIKTYGCQMNVYDSERMADVLAPEGYDVTDTPNGADLVVLNTCHIREKATEKVYSELGKMRRLKEASNGKMRIAVAGCVAQAEGEEILARQPAVDLVLGPQTYHKLPEMLSKPMATRADRVADAFTTQEKFASLPKARGTRNPVAFLSVQEGCDKFCSFCVVPYTRGAEVSRSVDDVIAEARLLARQGVRDISLLGQNVNAWHGAAPDDPDAAWSLGQLCRHIAQIGGIDRIRYSTSHPSDMDADLIATHGDTAAMMPFLHLPVQSGSDAILDAMNRKHTRAHYFDIMRQVRTARPDIALASDFIVGFPGETDQDFEDTLALVEDVNYAVAYSFKYSQRPGTPAADRDNQVDEAVKLARLHRLQDLLKGQQTRFNASKVGESLAVLVTGKGRKDGQMHGRSPYMQSVHFNGPPALVGQIVNVEITKSTLNSLGGIWDETNEQVDLG